MRKIVKSPNVPATLKNAKVPTNKGEVKDTIYGADDVRKQLLKDQYDKCAFCEARILRQYNDVEHYRPKSHYYWLGHEWENLLYSCPTCNRSYKRTEFPLDQGSVQANSPNDNIGLEKPLIINPAFVDPAEHIRFNRHKAVHLTPAGEKTIEVFHLNDRDERPELIKDRETLFEDYESALKEQKLAEAILNSPASPQVYEMARELSLRSNIRLERLTALGTPFSGMLLTQKK